VLSGRGLCYGPTTWPKKSWCVLVCDLETHRMRWLWPVLGCCTREEKPSHYRLRESVMRMVFIRYKPGSNTSCDTGLKFVKIFLCNTRRIRKQCCEYFRNAFHLRCDTACLAFSVLATLHVFFMRSHIIYLTCKKDQYTRWFKYDRDKLLLVYTQIVPVIFEPPCIFVFIRSETVKSVFSAG
jgi:hypothetical protein